MLPRVIKHQLPATISHHKTYSGTYSELRTKHTRTSPYCYTDPGNLNTEDCKSAFDLLDSRAQEFITRRTIIFSAICLHLAVNLVGAFGCSWGFGHAVPILCYSAHPKLPCVPLCKKMDTRAGKQELS